MAYLKPSGDKEVCGKWAFVLTDFWRPKRKTFFYFFINIAIYNTWIIQNNVCKLWRKACKWAVIGWEPEHTNTILVVLAPSGVHLSPRWSISSAPLNLELLLLTPEHPFLLFGVPATGTGKRGNRFDVFKEMAEVPQITSYILLPELNPIVTSSCRD